MLLTGRDARDIANGFYDWDDGYEIWGYPCILEKLSIAYSAELGCVAGS